MVKVGHLKRSLSKMKLIFKCWGQTKNSWIVWDCNRNDIPSSEKCWKHWATKLLNDFHNQCCTNLPKASYHARQSTNSFIIFLSCWAAHNYFTILGDKTSHFGKALLNKAPNKGGKGRAKKENPKSKPKAQKPKVGHKGQRNKLCSKPPPPSQKAYQRGKWNLKRSEA